MHAGRRVHLSERAQMPTANVITLGEDEDIVEVVVVPSEALAPGAIGQLRIRTTANPDGYKCGPARGCLWCWGRCWRCRGAVFGHRPAPHPRHSPWPARAGPDALSRLGPGRRER
jgi:hypothetical protein